MPLGDYIGHYYVRLDVDFRQAFRPGQMYWAPTFYLPPHPEVLFELDPDPTERNLRFQIRRHVRVLTGEIDGHIAELRTELIGELYR